MSHLLVKINIIHTTSKRNNANTDAGFTLIASTSGADFVQSFENLPHNERERGRTDEYVFDVSGRGIPTDTELTIRMTSTSDGWLPQTIWAIGETNTGEHVLLAANPSWTEWFDRGSRPAGPDSHIITG